MGATGRQAAASTHLSQQDEHPLTMQAMQRWLLHELMHAAWIPQHSLSVTVPCCFRYLNRRLGYSVYLGSSTWYLYSVTPCCSAKAAIMQPGLVCGVWTANTCNADGEA